MGTLNINTDKRVENKSRSGVFLTKFEVFGGVWIADETHSRGFDICSQSRRGSKIVKTYAN